ncbi:MAG: type II toxin-antitoxin system PemK/MazF family toxin [Deltaproteobacteria bacterium]|nr:MAG: type II toxin-antitoxin system PemK/MazF family toxin [Deltaproteobacteria bacterium]
MVIAQGDLFWADLSPPRGSEPGTRRPVVVVQRDSINRSKFRTVLVVPLTRQTRYANIPGNVLLPKETANLPASSLARCTHLMVLDKGRVGNKIGTLPREKTEEILRHITWVLGGPLQDSGW